MTIKVSIAGLHLDARISHVRNTTPQQLFQDFTIQNVVLVRDRIQHVCRIARKQRSIDIEKVYSDGTIPITNPGEIYAL